MPKAKSKNKTRDIAALILGTGAIGWFVIRPMISPKFNLESFDNRLKIGTVFFDGKMYPFTIAMDRIITGRNRYELSIVNKNDGYTDFILLKNGIPKTTFKTVKLDLDK